jgi:hypothetical protein
MSTGFSLKIQGDVGATPEQTLHKAEQALILARIKMQREKGTTPGEPMITNDWDAIVSATKTTAPTKKKKKKKRTVQHGQVTKTKKKKRAPMKKGKARAKIGAKKAKGSRAITFHF